MKIRDYLASAMAGDVNDLANFVYLARFTLGLDYKQTLVRVQKDYPDTTAASWEALMQMLEAEDMLV